MCDSKKASPPGLAAGFFFGRLRTQTVSPARAYTDAESLWARHIGIVSGIRRKPLIVADAPGATEDKGVPLKA